jgi:hypothetical protein
MEGAKIISVSDFIFMHIYDILFIKIATKIHDFFLNIMFF